MNERAEKFRQELQKELGLTVGPKDPILAEWLAHEEFRQEIAAEHQRMLVAFEEGVDEEPGELVRKRGELGKSEFKRGAWSGS